MLLVLGMLVVLWDRVWPYLLAAACATVVGGLAWCGRKVHRRERAGDSATRKADELTRAHRSLSSVDTLSGEDFELFIAELCRRDGYTKVERVGGAGDHGVDVKGVLPDGRSMVIQCKRYAAHRPIPSEDIRGLLGSIQHFTADVGVFVTTSRFSKPALAFAAQHGIITVHRNHLALWNAGTPLHALEEVSGTGQGDGRHLRTWNDTYRPVRPPRGRKRPGGAANRRP